MPDTVLNIGDNAFSDCISLAGVTIPGLLPRLGNGLFIGCTSLTNIALGNSITSIGTNAFNDCTSLTSVTIPYGVTNLGQAAFGNCTSLTYVCFQGNVPTSSGNLVFLSDPVTVIYYLAGATGWGSNYEGIATAPCAQCSQTTPNPYNGFYWTQVVNAVTITLYDGAGGSVVIPATIAGLPVTSIGANAFFGGASLTSVTIGTNVTSIGLDAFAECYSLTAITVASNNPAYVSVAGVLFNQGQTTLIDTRRPAPKPLMRYPARSPTSEIMRSLTASCPASPSPTVSPASARTRSLTALAWPASRSPTPSPTSALERSLTAPA